MLLYQWIKEQINDKSNVHNILFIPSMVAQQRHSWCFLLPCFTVFLCLSHLFLCLILCLSLSHLLSLSSLAFFLLHCLSLSFPPFSLTSLFYVSCLFPISFLLCRSYIFPASLFLCISFFLTSFSFSLSCSFPPSQAHSQLTKLCCEDVT